jgi:hypothetical protein
MNNMKVGFMKKSSYMKIYDTLKEQIGQGELPVGMRLPTEPILSQQFGVSISTLRRAMVRLEMEKYVRREQGRGTFVNKVSGYGSVAAKVDGLNFGCFVVMKEQNVLNNIYFDGGKVNQISLNETPVSNMTGTSLLQSLSLIQVPLHRLSPDTLGLFSPLPEDIVELAEASIPEHILNECYTFDGSLRLLPAVANPSVCYCWKPAFEKAGIELPRHDWTYRDFVSICRKLKTANEQPAFGLMPFPGVFYEPLFWSHGCEFIDEYGEPRLPEADFYAAAEILRVIHEEKLCVDLTYSSVPPHKFFTRPGVCMTFCGPLVLSALRNKNEWYVLPTPEVSGVTTICLGIPDASHEKREMEKLLKSLVSSQGVSRMAAMQGEAPATVPALKKWSAGLGISGADAFVQSLSKGHPISPRTGFSLWQRKFYQLLDRFVRRQISREQLRNELIAVLEENRIYSGEVTAFI